MSLKQNDNFNEHQQEIEGIISFGDELRGRASEQGISDYSHAYQLGYQKGRQDKLKELREWLENTLCFDYRCDGNCNKVGGWRGTAIEMLYKSLKLNP